MKLQQLGRSTLEVSELCFGGNVFGWTVDEGQSFKILDKFFANGGNFIDTADVYSNWIPGNKGGESETIIGKWISLRKNRNKMIIATKVGKPMSATEKGLSKRYIFQAVDKSLQRLQTDYIDLYQSHEDDPHTPFEETLAAFDELIKQGKVRAIGASNYKADRLQQTLTVSKKCNLMSYQSVQPHYNLYNRKEFEQELAPICRDYGLGVISYFSLAAGFLTGKYRSENDLKNKKRAGAVRNYLNPRGFKILEALDMVAKRYKTTPTAIALSWIMANPLITAPIVSATTEAQLDDILSATSLRLNEEDLQMLDISL